MKLFNRLASALAADVCRSARNLIGTTARLGVLFGILHLGLASAAQVSLAWDDNSDDETGFKLEKSVAGGPFVEILLPPGVLTGVVTYVDTDVTLGTEYSYRVRAYNEWGNSAYSNVVSNAPTIITHAANQTVTADNDAAFTVAVSGAPSPTLQWQLSADAGATWTPLANASPYSGVTTTTLSITGAPAGLDANQYRCVATSILGSVASTAAVLTVNTVPVFTIQPTAQTVTAGGSLTFIVTANGKPSPTFQWQRSTDEGTTWIDLTEVSPYSGVATATLAITAATTTLNTNQYRCVATNAAASTASAAAQLAEFLHLPLDVAAMAGVVDSALYRQRAGAPEPQTS